MIGSMLHTIAYGIHNMVCIGIPHGNMTISYNMILALA